MSKAIIWCRVSTDKQEWETQRKDLMATATSKEYGFAESDLIVIGEEGASAIKMNEVYQKEVNQLLHTIATTPEVTTIFVWEVSRLARNEIAFYQMKNTIIDNHIQLICQVPQLKLLDDDGEVNRGSEITLNLLVTLAKQEMEINKKRFARGKKKLALAGKYNGGVIPYGYKKDETQDNLIVVDEGGEADVVREVYNLYEHGLSQPSIAKELFKRGIKGRAARQTKKFTVSLVHQILTNELLTGKPHKSAGASYERTYPMIITPEQFKRCREIAKANNTKATKAHRVYYAHRLIECLVCKRKFVSTGNKGYYHCWDAYYPNKDINGYEGIPKCSNKICISTNIMDSLLWELAQEYEAMFILNSAQKKLEDCEQAKSVIEQKIAAIPSRRQILEQRMDDLLDARAEGMKKEKFQKRKKVIEDERREIEADEAKYNEQLLNYKILIAEIKASLNSEDNLGDENGITNYIETVESAVERLSSITDDSERSRIIHKHFEKVTIEATTINYKFDKYPDGKDVLAKKILIYPFSCAKPREFYFIPFNGKGGVMLSKNDNAGEVYNIGGLATSLPLYQEYRMTYLKRTVDKGKNRRREIERAKRENIKSLGTEKLRKQGYISMNEMRETSKLSYDTIRKAIRDGKMEGTNLFRTWYVKKQDFEAYIKREKPIARPRKQVTSVVHPQEIEQLERAEKLLKEILNSQE